MFSQNSVLRTPHKRGKITSNNIKIWYDSQENCINVVLQHYSLNDRNNYWVSFVPPGLHPESGRHSSFLCGCFFHLQVAVPLAHCSVLCARREGAQEFNYVWTSSEQWEGPWRNKVMALARAACGSPGKGWTQKQPERQGLSLSSLLNILLERRTEVRSSSIEHSEVHEVCRTRSTAGSPLTWNAHVVILYIQWSVSHHYTVFLFWFKWFHQFVIPQLFDLSNKAYSLPLREVIWNKKYFLATEMHALSCFHSWSLGRPDRVKGKEETVGFLKFRVIVLPSWWAPLIWTGRR